MIDYIELAKKLESDLEEMGNLVLKNQRNSALENAYVRTFFSTIEGVMFAFRQEAIASAKYKEVFDLAEQAKLLEKRYDPIKKIITDKPNYLRFKESTKFSCRCLAKARGVKPSDLGFCGVGWDNFLAANTIRDQLTHPKRIEDLTLSAQEFEIVVKAKVWLTEQVLQKLVK